MNIQSTKKKLIIFVRHGESEANKYLHENEVVDEDKLNSADPGLTNRGYHQAVTTSEYLLAVFALDRASEIHVMFSPLERAKKTFAVFSSYWRGRQGGMILGDEVLALFEWSPLKKKMPQELLEKGLKNDDSWDDFIIRVVMFKNFLKEKIRSIEPGEAIVIFGHSLFFSVLMQHLMCQELFFPSEGHISLQIPNCSISCFEYKEGGFWDFYLLCSIHHLGALASGHHIPFGLDRFGMLDWSARARERREDPDSIGPTGPP